MEDQLNGDEHDLFCKDILPSTSLPFDEPPHAIGFEFDATIEDVTAVNALWTSFYGCPDAEEIRRLVARAGGCAHLDLHGKCVLHVATAMPSALSVLLQMVNPALIEQKDRRGWTPLATAVVGRHSDSARLLLNRGAGPTEVQVACPLIGRKKTQLYHFACFDGDITMIELLADCYGWPCIDTHGRNGAHYAAMKGCAQVIMRLSNEGVPLDLRDTDGRTPVFFACACGNREALKVLWGLQGYRPWDDTYITAPLSQVTTPDEWDVTGRLLATIKRHTRVLDLIESSFEKENLALPATDPLEDADAADSALVQMLKTAMMEQDTEKLARTVKAVGTVKSMELYMEATQLQRNGGQKAPNGKPKTHGGIFFGLVKSYCTPEEYKYVDQLRRQRQKAVKQRKATGIRH